MSKITVRLSDKRKSFTSSHVVIMRDDGKILIMRRASNDEWMPGHYGLPGGKLDPGEDTLQAIKRECFEEAGLTIDPKHLVFLPKVSKDMKHGFYYTRKFSGEPKLDFEHDDFKWVNPKELSNFKTVPDLIDIVNAVLEDLA